MLFLKLLFGIETAEDNLRIVITRHGERADLAIGPRWASNMQRYGRHDPRISYLTPRANFHEWHNDPPLTADGERQSISIGRKLLQLGCPIDYCYSSPAYRAIQTADKILQSQGRKAVPINIEPGLFECPSWYADAAFSFIPPEHIAMDKHFNINPYYTPIYNDVDIKENERRYYQRSRRLIDSIVKTHKNQGGTILLSGHAGSIEVIASGVIHRRGRRERLIHEAEKVDYCNFAILERDAHTGRWSVHLPITTENPYGGQRTIESSIPLYSPTSRYIPTNHFSGPSFFLRDYPYEDRSYHHRRHRYRYR